ncbi:hypothetical protein LXL04_023086 [Taraxacum kok-saghyz]
MLHRTLFLRRSIGAIKTVNVRRSGGVKGSQTIFYADFITAILIRAIGQLLQVSDTKSLKSLGATRHLNLLENFPSGDIAALVYLWNPLTIITCLGYSTSPIENLVIVLALLFYIVDLFADLWSLTAGSLFCLTQIVGAPNEEEILLLHDLYRQTRKNYFILLISKADERLLTW